MLGLHMGWMGWMGNGMYRNWGKPGIDLKYPSSSLRMKLRLKDTGFIVFFGTWGGVCALSLSNISS